MTKYLRVVGLIVSVLLVTALVKTILLGSSPYIPLKPAPPVANAISQSLSANDKGVLLQLNKDYVIKKSHYFENNSWAVASIALKDSPTNTAVVVMQKKQAIFQVVAGPGTSFSANQTDYFPKSVTDYMDSIGASFYVPED